MENIFYSKKEKIAFWVAGFEVTSFNSEDIQKYLNKNTQKAKDLFNCSARDIYTRVIHKSRRYKYMRVFYTKTDIIPSNSFPIFNWTMDEWLSN